jgi:hypothetical protein
MSCMAGMPHRRHRKSVVKRSASSILTSHRRIPGPSGSDSQISRTMTIGWPLHSQVQLLWRPEQPLKQFLRCCHVTGFRLVQQRDDDVPWLVRPGPCSAPRRVKWPAAGMEAAMADERDTPAVVGYEPVRRGGRWRELVVGQALGLVGAAALVAGCAAPQVRGEALGVLDPHVTSTHTGAIGVGFPDLTHDDNRVGRRRGSHFRHLLGVCNSPRYRCFPVAFAKIIELHSSEVPTRLTLILPNAVAPTLGRRFLAGGGDS